MKIYLARHTSVDVPSGTCYGQTDVPLNNTFENEAEILKLKLKDKHPDAVFSSPLSRCIHLANYCGYENIQLDDRLKELFFGDWEMGIWDELDMSAWQDDWVDAPTPNGESFRQMYNRVAEFLDELQKKNYESVLIFTHGGVINCTKVYFGRTDWRSAFDELPKYGELLEFEV